MDNKDPYQINDQKPIHSSLLPSEGRLMLLFGGFVGCDTTCPPSLEVMRQVYETYLKTYNNKDLKLVYVNLSTTAHPDSVIAYAQAFHEDFIPIHLKRTDKDNLLKQLGVVFTPAIYDPDTIHHSNFIYLLKKRGQTWTHHSRFLDSVPDPDKIIAEINALVAKSP
ncbi:SCO family protein [Magnetococcales bacterium HHB-1]